MFDVPSAFGDIEKCRVSFLVPEDKKAQFQDVPNLKHLDTAVPFDAYECAFETSH